MAPRESQLTPRARAQLGVLGEVRHKWDHLHALVEQLASRPSAALRPRVDRTGRDPDRAIVKQVRRAAVDVYEVLAGGGFSALAQDVQELIVLARRRERIRRPAVRRMQEIVGAVYHGIEVAEKLVWETGAASNENGATGGG